MSQITKTFSNEELLKTAFEVKEILQKELFISQKAPFKQLLVAIEPYVKAYEDLKNELIKKYGDAGSDGSVMVKQFVDDDSSKGYTENFKSFFSEIVALNSEKVEITFTAIPASKVKDISTTATAILDVIDENE